MLGNLILGGLKNDESPAAIERRIQEALSSHLGVETEAISMETTILGYATYFNKKGLI